ncbi:UNVERIFIED_CONTAM: hypothetical protein Sradi_7080900 [Sesamum radiatum]|uniref:Reverse transcriptase domain-containing protein n=1 Tax=Sesamum radiatum TaxID=300843 RepID=A0AAW2J3R8_SESRA
MSLTKSCLSCFTRSSRKPSKILSLPHKMALFQRQLDFPSSSDAKDGFPPRFLILIKHAIQNYWFTVLVNGEGAGFFKSTQGLRQGDLISLALFILTAEAFSKGLDLLFNENPDMFYQTKCEAQISHLSYADDVILFTNCKEEGLTKLMQFLGNMKNFQSKKSITLRVPSFLEREPTTLPKG